MSPYPPTPLSAYSIAAAAGLPIGLKLESSWFAALLMASKKPVFTSYWLLSPEKALKSLCCSLGAVWRLLKEDGAF